MNENFEKAKKQYLEIASKKTKEVFDYFQVGDAFEAGVKASENVCDTVFNKFLEKAGSFIQGLDAEEIYEIYSNAKKEVLF